MPWNKFFLYLLVMAGVTYLLRMLPLLLIKKKITNKFIISFLHYIPYAVLTAMTIPAIFYSTTYLISGILGFITAFILAFKNKSLITVAGISCLVVLISELLIYFIK